MGVRPNDLRKLPPGVFRGKCTRFRRIAIGHKHVGRQGFIVIRGLPMSFSVTLPMVNLAADGYALPCVETVCDFPPHCPFISRIEDRNSMAHSVEARLPFLDYRLVSFCLWAARRMESSWAME